MRLTLRHPLYRLVPIPLGAVLAVAFTACGFTACMQPEASTDIEDVRLYCDEVICGETPCEFMSEQWHRSWQECAGCYVECGGPCGVLTSLPPSFTCQ